MAKASRTTKARIAVERLTLPNGLRVVLSPDRSASGVFVGVYYDVGFRSEPEGRTGFAHLFEHLMFQGSATLEKGLLLELVNGNGGVLNGSTRNDFTNYFELMPPNALELALFLESDRMRGLALTPENLQNQIDVVKEEIRVNVQNSPYGGFPWLYLPMVLFNTFPNAHDAYGDFGDLEAASLEDAATFFDTYYSPGNAVLTVCGDIGVDDATAMIERHFGDIPSRKVPPTVDAGEPVPTSEIRETRTDPMAPQPAMAIGYRVPDPITDLDDYAAAVLVASLLTDGDASRLYQRLVKQERVASHIGGGVGLVADTFEVRGPSMLQLQIFYPGSPDPDRVLKPMDDEIARLADGVDPEELDRFRNAWVAGYLGSIDSLMARGMMVSALEQQRERAELINEIPEVFGRVTSQDIARVASEWLRPDSRAVLDWRPGGGS